MKNICVAALLSYSLVASLVAVSKTREANYYRAEADRLKEVSRSQFSKFVGIHRGTEECLEKAAQKLAEKPETVYTTVYKTRYLKEKQPKKPDSVTVDPSLLWFWKK